MQLTASKPRVVRRSETRPQAAHRPEPARSQAARPQQASALYEPVTVDRRTLRTRLALRDALAAEIEATGDLSQVTVTAVTDRAGVTRRTFYSHFRDIPDLVNQIEDETIAELRPLVVQLVQVNLEELSRALNDCDPCPGSEEILRYFQERASFLPPLLGNGGDPAFVQKIKTMVHDAVKSRAMEGIDPQAIGPLFDYYLTFAISAEVGVLVRWLTTGLHESVEAMSRIMTGLMFVRPGDLYGTTIDFNVPAFGLTLLGLKEENDD